MESSGLCWWTFVFPPLIFFRMGTHCAQRVPAEGRGLDTGAWSHILACGIVISAPGGCTASQKRRKAFRVRQYRLGKGS